MTRDLPAPRSDGHSLAVVSGHLALMFAPVYLAAAVGPGWSTLLFWLWFGLLAQGALLLLHECVHKLLFRNVRWNEFLAGWIVSPLFLADFEAFRRRHWAHHRELGLAGDPKYTYRMDIRGWRLLGLVLSCLIGFQALRRTSYQAGERSETTPESTRRTLVGIALVQGTLATSLLAVARAAHPESWLAAGVSAAVAYGFVYLYGTASLGVLMHALRGIIEHRPLDPTEPRQHEAALRNFSEGPIQRLVFASYGFADHATHHAHPGVPYYQLPTLTRRARSRTPASIRSAAI